MHPLNPGWPQIKPGKLRAFEKLSESQGKLREIWNFVEKS